jgi:hypothetical protein
MINRKNSDELIQGIDFIISKNRRSFSKQEIKILEDCITLLKEIEDVPNHSFWYSREFEEVFKLLIKPMLVDTALDVFKGWFD